MLVRREAVWLRFVEESSSLHGANEARGNPLGRDRRDLPRDGVEQGLKLERALGVEHGEVGDAAAQVGAEVGVGEMVLAAGADFDAVVEGGFESVELGSGEVRVLIDNDAGHALAGASAEDAGLAVVDSEALLNGDGAGVDGKALHGASEFGAAGEDEVVGVTGVMRLGGGCQGVEAGVEAIGAEVGEGGGRGRPLGEVGGRIELAEPPEIRAARGRGGVAPEGVRCAIRAEAGNQPGDGLGVTGGHENSNNPGGIDRGEEVSEVELEDDFLASMRLGEGADGAAGAVGVGGVVWGY